MELRRTVDVPEGHLQDLRAQAGSAHAKQDGIGEVPCASVLGHGAKMVEVSQLVVRHREPAHPLTFVRTGPEGRIARPQARDLILGLPLCDRRIDIGLQWRRQLRALPPSRGSARLTTGCHDDREELVERVAKQGETSLQEPVRDRLERHPDSLQSLHRVAGGVEALVKGHANTPVVSKRLVGRRWHRVDGFRSNQRLDVIDVWKVRVLRPRARPQEPLRSGSLPCQSLPSRAARDLPVPLIGELGVRDGNPALEPVQPGACVLLRSARNLFSQECIDRGINAADEEARHARNMV